MPPKRKATAACGTKFYGVRAGHNPGVYFSWADCQEQTNGFSGAVFKSFPTEQEARDFAAGIPLFQKPDNVVKLYAVVNGERLGIYHDWTEAQQALRQHTGSKSKKLVKKFTTQAEAEEFLRQYGAMDNELDQTKLEMASTPPAPGVTQVWTDGSSRNNGNKVKGSSAGVGVYFGAHDIRNRAERLPGPMDMQTNQRAELTGILRAFEIAGSTEPLEIITDSMYAINCVETWAGKWESSGWKTNNGPVKNKDLVEACRMHYKARKALGTLTKFTWVQGHASCEGNIEADKLARRGAAMPAVE